MYIKYIIYIYRSLNNNKIKDLPDELFKLPNLEILYVHFK